MPGFEVRNAEVEKQLKEIGRAIAKDLPDGFGFTLFIFSFGEGGSTFYLSNANRDDMLAAMREFMERQEAMRDRTN